MLKLFIPIRKIPEKMWIMSVILGEFLGLAFSVEESTCDEFTIHHANKTLTLHDVFFCISKDKWLATSTLPQLPLVRWDVNKSGLYANLVDSTIPILFGHPGFHMDESGNGHLSLDVFGSAFFMLSRYEELVVQERDNFGRFPATASFAYKAGFLDRPIVDEYVEILWTAMQEVWPGLERKSKQGKVLVSCDVDQPFDRVGSNVIKLFRSVAGDIGKRKNLKLAYRRIRNFIESPKGNLKFDPYYTFDWYMDICEQYNLKVAFYFISDHSGGTMDGTYNINEPRVLNLIKQIAERGHEIGVHGSYNTFNNPRQIIKERQILIDACQKSDVDQPVIGNRQHYLRWDSAQTPDYLNAAGYEYDTTGSFADVAGFRYGTSKEFSMWGWQKQSGLKLKQRPLIVMECSIISSSYMNLGYSDETKRIMLDLREKSLKYGGNFSFLWHNSEFLFEQDSQFFKMLLKN